MSSYRLLSVLFLLFFVHFSANAEKLALRWYYTSESITGYAQFLKDESNTYTIEDVKSEEFQKIFSPFTEKEMNQGINNASYWFKLQLFNPRANGMTWVIYPGSSYVDNMEVWVKNGKRPWQYRKRTDHNNFSNRALNYRLLNTTFRINEKETAEVYIRLSSKEVSLNHINLYIAGQSNLRDILAKEYMIYGVYYGLFIALILLIISIWFYAQTHSYRYYFYFLSYLVFNILLWLSLNGFSFQFLWPKTPYLHNQSLDAIYLLVSSFSWLFSRELLNTKLVSPRIDKLLILLVLLFLSSICLRIFGVAYDFVFYVALFSLVSLVLQPIIAWYCYRKRSTYLILFIIAWIPYSLSVLLYILASTFSWGINVMPYLQLSVLFECMLLIISTLSKMQYRSETLERLTLIDPLTQLGNRRQLEEHIEEVSQQEGEKDKYWLLLADIDLFKTINDNYGHSVGDDVLVKLSKLMKKVCRADDIAIRWGGEEFLLLIKVDSKDLALSIAERIRKSFEDAPTPVDEGHINHTLSIGLHPLELELTDALSNAIECADKALYQAKETGRNQCIVYNESSAGNE